ncbi:IS3 family transposase [Bradyrhizobium archetypum]|uniref:IS3 family transposase n=1 Tax=Bradyrhizobium archetypum TaxID=2721160 RepID=A0A7Y4H2J3_9BRAD|nr:IS3 family transposase [Bradyrhizobium archetypum]
MEGATFDNLDHFAKELFEYLIYYNNHRPIRPWSARSAAG